MANARTTPSKLGEIGHPNTYFLMADLERATLPLIPTLIPTRAPLLLIPTRGSTEPFLSFH